MKKRIILDFDGTICGFKFPDCGPPEPGVKEALLDLQAMGFEIVIHSCRTGIYWKGTADTVNRIFHIKAIVGFMAEHNLYYDELLTDINMDKPIADFYIDDRGVGYKGNWNEVVREIGERNDD